MSETKFCSVLTQNSSEPLAGTAPSADHFVFISWPKRFWKYEALESGGGFPQGLKKWLKNQNIINGKISIRLVSQAGLEHETVEIFIYPGQWYYSKIQPGSIKEVLEAHFQSEKYNSISAEKLRQEQIFICTHGRHDKCCAKFGQKLADKMRQQVLKHNLAVEVWDSSHLGGHRFAATMIDFPGGSSYGHLTADEIPKFIASRKQGDIYGSAYRGSVFLSGLEQVAEALLQHFCHSRQWSCQFNLRHVEQLTEDKFKCVAEFNHADNSGRSQNHRTDELIFSFGQKNFESPAGCDAPDELQNRKCWVIESHRYNL
ncbi:MAG: hypothetical protein H8E38_07370 [SAR324 cluster bacterium]|nr:hypothetical protein [SAR324 cluster bacterium]MBL7034479.1 hypothetical protein [SAR324 cluster bacterium]